MRHLSAVLLLAGCPVSPPSFIGLDLPDPDPADQRCQTIGALAATDTTVYLTVNRWQDDCAQAQINYYLEEPFAWTAGADELVERNQPTFVGPPGALWAYDGRVWNEADEDVVMYGDDEWASALAPAGDGLIVQGLDGLEVWRTDGSSQAPAWTLADAREAVWTVDGCVFGTGPVLEDTTEDEWLLACEGAEERVPVERARWRNFSGSGAYLAAAYPTQVAFVERATGRTFEADGDVVAAWASDGSSALVHRQNVDGNLFRVDLAAGTSEVVGQIDGDGSAVALAAAEYAVLSGTSLAIVPAAGPAQPLADDIRAITVVDGALLFAGLDGVISRREGDGTVTELSRMAPASVHALLGRSDGTVIADDEARSVLRSLDALTGEILAEVEL